MVQLEGAVGDCFRFDLHCRSETCRAFSVMYDLPGVWVITLMSIIFARWVWLQRTGDLVPLLRTHKAAVVCGIREPWTGRFR